MTMQFDYAAAHKALAIPAYNALPESVRAIYRDLADMEGLAQRGPDLLVPMPDALAPRFEAIDSYTLALASKAIHDYGHWASEAPDTRGATWKFSNLADQVLRARLGIPAGLPKGIGYAWSVHEGTLRLCASTPNSWTWVVVGPATADFLRAAREWRDTLTPCPTERYSRSSAQWQAFERQSFNLEVPAALRAQIPDTFRALMDAGKDYMREKGKCSNDCPECGKPQIFKSPECNHDLKCSRYPLASRIDDVFRHAESVYGLTPAQVSAARAAILGDPLDNARNALRALVAHYTASNGATDFGPAALALQMLDTYPHTIQ